MLPTVTKTMAPTVTNSMALPRIAHCKPFKNHGGTFSGRYVDRVYTVFSYTTPIATYCRGRWEIDATPYSQTTKRHQTIVSRALSGPHGPYSPA